MFHHAVRYGGLADSDHTAIRRYYLYKANDWNTSRTVGMLVFLAGATCRVFLDNSLSAESSLLPWIEPIAAVIMLVGYS